MAVKIGQNREKVILDQNGSFTDSVFFLELDICTAKYKKRYLNMVCILLSFIIHLNIFLVFVCAFLLTCLLNLQILALF